MLALLLVEQSPGEADQDRASTVVGCRNNWEGATLFEHHWQLPKDAALMEVPSPCPNCNVSRKCIIARLHV